MFFPVFWEKKYPSPDVILLIKSIPDPATIFSYSSIEMFVFIQEFISLPFYVAALLNLPGLFDNCIWVSSV